MTIKNALKELLDNLEIVDEKYPQIHDTAVREDLHAAIIDYFVYSPRYGDLPPDANYSMLRKRGDKAVHKALVKFLTHPEVKAAQIELTTPEARLEAFQDNDVKSSNGNEYWWYFGWSPGLSPDKK